MRSAIATALLVASVARAQLCHAPPPEERRPLGLGFKVSSEFASYRTSRYEGEYQGLSIQAAWSHRRVQARAVLPAYRLMANGAEYFGLGDLLLDVRVPVARTEDGALTGGVALAMSAPTGNRERQLGMGHAMAMPGLWAAWKSERAFVQAQAGWGRAATDTGSSLHSTHGPSPVVNPMNFSEFELAAFGGYLVHKLVRVRSGLYGAVPAASVNGAPRTSVFVGVDFSALEWFDFGLETHLSLVGDAFQTKGVAFVGARF